MTSLGSQTVKPARSDIRECITGIHMKTESADLQQQVSETLLGPGAATNHMSLDDKQKQNRPLVCQELMRAANLARTEKKQLLTVTSAEEHSAIRKEVPPAVEAPVEAGPLKLRAPLRLDHQVRHLQCLNTPKCHRQKDQQRRPLLEEALIANLVNDMKCTTVTKATTQSAQMTGQTSTLAELFACSGPTERELYDCL